ncbi:MAG: hypothetical protein OEU91_09820 [Gammaproteobacteria bacterium]|nr:hypothetical protein [Gammaproteobacteria bacterium]
MNLRKTAFSFCLLVHTASVAQEDIDLESTFVGDREQPAVSYITPWKAPEGPDKLYRPIRSISANVLDPVDRDILSRNIQYYSELSLEDAAGRY